MTSFSFHSFPDWTFVHVDFRSCLPLLKHLSGAATWEQKAQLKEGCRECICSIS